jgi:hypothetical protein
MRQNYFREARLPLVLRVMGMQNELHNDDASPRCSTALSSANAR